MNIPRNIPWNIPWNMKMSEMGYSTKNQKQVKYRDLWNMEYSRNIPNIDFPF